MSWPADTLTALIEDEEIDLVISAPGKKDLRFPVWVIVVDDAAYVRSYKGPTALWYGRVTQNRDGAIVVGGTEFEVRFEVDLDPTTASAIDAGYAEKYARHSYVEAMIADTVKATTLRLDPR